MHQRKQPKPDRDKTVRQESSVLSRKMVEEMTITVTFEFMWRHALGNICSEIKMTAIKKEPHPVSNAC